MTLPLNLNTARIDQTQVLSLIHALVSLACRQSEEYVQSLDSLAQGKVPISLFQREVWNTAFKAFKVKMKRLKLVPVLDDPSVVFRSRVTTLVVKDDSKEKLRIAIPIALVSETDYPYTVYRMQPSIIFLGDKPFYFHTDTLVAVRPNALPMEFKPQDLETCEKPYLPFLRICESLPKGRNTSCLSDILQQSSRAECSHLISAIDESRVFVKMNNEGRVLVFSPDPIRGEIRCPSSSAVEVSIKGKTASKLHVLPPCELELDGKTFSPNTFSPEVSLDSYPDPQRELTLAAAQVLNGVQSLLNKQHSTRSVAQLYSDMLEQGQEETNLEEYLISDPLQEVYKEVSGTLTPHLPLWLTVLTGTFLTLTGVALICAIWDNCNKRRAKKERRSNRKRFVEASRLTNMNTEGAQFQNLLRLL